VCVDLDGTLLSRTTGGGSNPFHNADAKATVEKAAREALALAHRSTSDVAALVAGLAGLNGPSDNAWAAEFIAIDAIPARAVNDSEVALAGAFGLGPGIVALSGTGSIILGRAVSGEFLREDWYQYYSGAARHLAFGVVQSVMLEEATDEDSALVASVLRHFGAATPAELRAHLRAHRHRDPRETTKIFGALAPAITAAATTSPLAAAACDKAAAALAGGIRLLAVDLGMPRAAVAPIGALATSEAIRSRLVRDLPDCDVVEPRLPPVGGAAIMALADAGVGATSAILDRLATGLV
jgi:glucosamine kinase